MSVSSRCSWAGVLLTLAMPLRADAQDRPAGWQRRAEATPIPVTVFHSTQSANLPTAETLRKGEWLFEISHRFLPPVSDGADALWGLDGPIYNRLGLAYAPADRVLVGVSRSNLDDNVELGAKVRVWEGAAASVPVMIALNGAVAWNTEADTLAGAEDNELQAYGQIVLNALLADRVALGVVPTLLHNPRIQEAVSESVFALGLNGQIYLSDHVSVLGEWVLTEERENLVYDPVAVGVELETGGHFFKIVVTNSARMNPSQFLGGAPFEFTPDEWRLGFNVTRLLTF
ncbi:MAG: DUF5777 family beta-barrel protein [Gemmatimonadota bacterium]